MTYWGFLLLFVVLPILVLGCLALIDRTSARNIPASLQARPFWVAVSMHMLIALAYTTLWDNYLVATKVWSYNPELVSGIIFGWVPIEEYTFFLLQPVLAGLFLLFLMRRFQDVEHPTTNARGWRILPVFILGAIWLGNIIILISGWRMGTYLALELFWALPPIALQVLFGGDILRKHSKLVLTGIFLITIYLGVADAIAIHAGTWSINPQKSLHFLIGGFLPVEELIFFLLTNTLVIFGIILFISAESWERIQEIKVKIRKTEEPNII